jgi:hypothetical protein
MMSPGRLPPDGAEAVGRAERLAAHRILTGLDEYDLEWQCELLVQESRLV